MKRSEWILIAIFLLSIATGLAFYPSLPERMAGHWNAQGEVNGYLPRFWGVFLFPIVAAFMTFIFLIIPRVDPKRENIARFRKYFDYLVFGLSLFLYYIYLLTLLWNVGYRFDLITWIIPPLAGLFYLIGVVLPRTEMNFTVGIRTPWTISSENVWRRTHEVGGIVFKICAIVALLGVAAPRIAIWLFFVPLLAAVLGLIVYSYLLYRKEERGRG